VAKRCKACNLLYRELHPCSLLCSPRCASRSELSPEPVPVGLHNETVDNVTQWRTIADLASWPRVVSCPVGRAVDIEWWHDFDSMAGGDTQLTLARARTRRRLPAQLHQLRRSRRAASCAATFRALSKGGEMPSEPMPLQT
jgi:hypothetical protein